MRKRPYSDAEIVFGCAVVITAITAFFVYAMFFV